jgi:hypothetical protein
MMFPYPWPVFLPTVARVLSDGKPHTREGLLPVVAQTHGLTAHQCKLTMANRQNIFANRITIALGRLVKTRAVAKSKNEHRAITYRMTEHGIEVVRRTGKEVKISDF